jgi:hypothetical protein
MRIVEQKSVNATGAARGARSTGGTGARFTIDSGAASPKAEAKAPISILGGLEALIAIKSEDNTREKRKRSVRRGQGMLDVLDELKIALLGGYLPPGLPARLSATLIEAGASGDPRLDGIVDAIELRAEVELAKLKKIQRRDG